MGLSNDQISEAIDKLEKDSKAMRTEVLKLCWYMRGALSYEEGMLLSYTDREVISEIIKENMEVTEKTRLPFF